MRIPFRSFSLLFVTAFLLTACYPPTSPVYEGVSVDAADPLVRRLTDMQDRRQADSLYTFLRHPDPTYRYLAARAFGSFTGFGGRRFTDTVTD